MTLSKVSDNRSFRCGNTCSALLYLNRVFFITDVLEHRAIANAVLKHSDTVEKACPYFDLRGLRHCAERPYG
jgi:hypothetical protein